MLSAMLCSNIVKSCTSCKSALKVFWKDTDRASCLSLAVTQIANPSQEEVDEVHQRFKVALKELFDSHKHLMPGWHAKELLIV